MSAPDPLLHPWLALVIGNTRLHWAAFVDNVLQTTWHTRHLNATDVASLIQQQFIPNSWASFTTDSVPLLPKPGHAEDDGLHNAELPLYIASVVPAQAALWPIYPGSRELHLDQIPLQNLYPTLGIDRALNLLGAGDRYGWPVLVIDAGTALTFTAGDARALMGGAILPGLTMQFQALGKYTANLPQAHAGERLPQRWAHNTPDAIQSGILYSTLATIHDFLADWHRRYPNAPAILTGGDGARLFPWLTMGDRTPHLQLDLGLMFGGMRCCRQFLLSSFTDR